MKRLISAPESKLTLFEAMRSQSRTVPFTAPRGCLIHSKFPSNCSANCEVGVMQYVTLLSQALNNTFAQNVKMTSHFLVRRMEKKKSLSIQITWSVPSSIQFSLVFANVGGVTGVWPWTKVKNAPKYLPFVVGQCWEELSRLSPVRVRCCSGLRSL